MAISSAARGRPGPRRESQRNVAEWHIIADPEIDSAWGKGDYVPPKGKVDPAIDMKTPPPVVGQPFDLNAAPANIKQAFGRATADGKSLVATLGKKAGGEGGTGWVYTTTSGAYGVNYPYRAAIANCCLGENLGQDAVYPSLAVDSEGRPLDGSSKKYVLHFDKGKLPPVDAFWSVTAYDADGYFIPNVLKRQALGDRDKLATNADGSLDLIIQADSPGAGQESNWLPVAKAPFTLLLRLYSPRSEVLDGAWTPPPVKRVS